MTDKLFENKNGLEICKRHGLIRCGECTEIEQYLEEVNTLRSQITTMREDIELMHEDYERRWKTATQLIDNPSSDLQQIRAAAKGRVYRRVKDDLEELLSRYPKEGETK